MNTGVCVFTKLFLPVNFFYRSEIVPKLKLVIPKGRIYDNVSKILDEAGIKLYVDERAYRPFVSDPDIEVKIMKPQNIPIYFYLLYTP